MKKIKRTRPENRERVAKFLELQRDWDAAGLSERVSEVNLIDVRDIRAQLAGDNSQIEVRLGAQDHGKRLKDALEVLDAQKQSPHGSMISYIDLSQGKRAIVGLTSGAHASDGPTALSRHAEVTGERTLERERSHQRATEQSDSRSGAARRQQAEEGSQRQLWRQRKNRKPRNLSAADSENRSR